MTCYCSGPRFIFLICGPRAPARAERRHIWGALFTEGSGDEDGTIKVEMPLDELEFWFGGVAVLAEAGVTKVLASGQVGIFPVYTHYLINLETSTTPSSPGGEISILQFRKEDAEQVHALLLEGLVYAADSPRNVALRRYLYLLASLLVLTFLLLLVSIHPSTHRAGLLGALIVLCGAAGCAYIYRSITQFFLHLCTAARATDIADISATYGVPLPGQTQSSGAFWVAVDETTTRVVGCVGLKYDPRASGTLRRMFVSAGHRRRGIGSMLLVAAMAHARCISPELELELETSEFQDAARRLYERHGFRLAGTRVMWLGAGLPMRMVRFERRMMGDEGMSS
ncbi:hypothetical protein C8R44DRAFT_865719 [Mycena epipterygia]|nr:hypothetical protein C8R44DRAFT_865719 [Mycena epipterygia]